MDVGSSLKSAGSRAQKWGPVGNSRTILHEWESSLIRQGLDRVVVISELSECQDQLSEYQELSTKLDRKKIFSLLHNLNFQLFLLIYRQMFEILSFPNVIF